MEGSLRRIAHYDYWSDKVRRSVVVDSKCDLLLYGNAERAIVEIAHRLAAKETVATMTDIRGTAFIRRAGDDTAQGWFEIDSTSVDAPGRVEAHVNPYMMISDVAKEQGATCAREDEAEAVAKDAEAHAGSVPVRSGPVLSVRPEDKLSPNGKRSDGKIPGGVGCNDQAAHLRA
ncbi:MAG: hypothetical protein B7Y54_14625 [Polaromonas sp. 35-63-240]|nr:MAG: hypothetical protein B7Y54_14625 [Polaromonas sp. 35-63-240]